MRRLWPFEMTRQKSGIGLLGQSYARHGIRYMSMTRCCEKLRKIRGVGMETDEFLLLLCVSAEPSTCSGEVGGSLLWKLLRVE
jgi:hypothetical protein